MTLVIVGANGKNVECDALKEWKINFFFKLLILVLFYSRNTHLLPLKPNSSFCHLN